jgi:hypothetical protein
MSFDRMLRFPQNGEGHGFGFGIWAVPDQSTEFVGAGQRSANRAASAAPLHEKMDLSLKTSPHARRNGNGIREDIFIPGCTREFLHERGFPDVICLRDGSLTLIASILRGNEIVSQGS